MDINPYAPTAPSDFQAATAGPTDRSLRFGGTVRRADVARLGYSRAGAIAAQTLMVAALAAGLLLITALLTEPGPPEAGAASRAWQLLLLGLMLFPLVLVTMWLSAKFSGLGLAGLLEKWSARIVGPVEGTIGEATVELVYPQSRTILPLDSLTGVRLSPEFIAASYDHRHMQLFFLPKHLFEPADFLQAQERLEPLAAERPWAPDPGAGLDPRVQHGEPVERFPRPQGTASFAGSLYLRDFQSTRVYREQMLRVYVYFAALAFLALCAALLVSMLFGLNWLVVLFAFLLLGLVAVRISRWKRAFDRNMPAGDQPILKLSGWLCSDGLTVNSAIASTTYQRDAFERVDFGDDSIELVLLGKVKQVVIVARRMFASPDDFERVRRWTGIL